MLPIIEELTTLFSAHANPQYAQRQHAYFRCKFNYFGIAQPQRTELQKIPFKKYPVTTINELSVIITSLWNMDKREYCHSALDLVQMYKSLWNQSTLILFKDCILNNSWWDTIDDIASNCVGPLCTQYPELMNTMDKWIDNENMWLRRTAIIFQLKYKTNTDTHRLFAYCQKRMHEKE
jgi:3-methyladenine DNA glycosylase AlkD